MSTHKTVIPHLCRAIAERRYGYANTIRCNDAISQVLRTDRDCSRSSPFTVRRHVRMQRRLASTSVSSPARSKLPRNANIPRPPRYTEADIDKAVPEHNPGRDPKRVKVMIWITGFAGAALGAYILFVLKSATASVEHYKQKEHQLQQDQDVSDRWLKTDRDYDKEVDNSERYMLMHWKRKRLIREAYGDVLEVSVGTGRNMELYDTRPYSASEDSSYGRSRRHMITSLTFNDFSPAMIENAKHKWDLRQRERRQADRFTGQVHWITGDAGKKGVIQRPEGGFDTIIQSMGICSMQDPVTFLRRLSQLSRQPGERIMNASTKRMQQEEDDDGHGGRIFLLEHGKGHYSWLNSFLDNLAPGHADRYGCWFNKDIGKIVEESGLVVERVRRYHLGTTWEIVLRPSPTPVAIEPELPQDAQTNTHVSPRRDAWWKVW